MLNSFVRVSFTPEQIHLAINHFPIVGLAVAIIPLVMFLVTDSTHSLASGLIAVFVCTAPTPVIMETGEQAEHRLHERNVEPPVDRPGLEWAEVHEERAKVSSILLYGSGLLAIITVFAWWRMRRALRPLAILLTLSSAIAVGFSVWTASAGGKIRHPELRWGPSPQEREAR